MLLILGVALVTIAVLAFASFAYGLLGDIGRAVCIGVVGIAALIVGMLLTKRLRVTAEGLTWAGLAALTIDAVLISDIPPVALLVSDGISSGIIILLITALAYVLRLIAAHMPDASLTTNTGSNQPAAHESSNEKGSAQSLPLRATTLYAMCALPFAVMSLFSALHIPNRGVQWVLALSAGAAASMLCAVLVRVSPRARYADFEWMAAIIAAMIALGIISIFGYTPIVDADPLLLAIIACAIPPVLWAVILVILHTKKAAHTGALLHPGHRVAPVFGFFWSLAEGTESLLRRVLSDALADNQAGRTIADLVMVAICIFAITAGALMARQSSRISTQERVSASIIGSLMLLIITAGDFPNGSPLPMVVSIVGYTAILAVCTISWMLAARPSIAQPAETAPYIPDITMMQVPQQNVPVRPASGSFIPSPFIPARSTQPNSEIMRTRPYPPAPEFVAPQSQPAVGQSRPAMPWPAQPMAQPQSIRQGPLTPSPASSQNRITHLLTPAQIIVTCATIIIGIVLLFLAGTNPQPYAPVDLFSILSGAAALIIGIRWLRVRPSLRSWPALWPALTLLMVPSLLMSWTETPSLPRTLALFTIAVCALLVGAIIGLQAPLIYGTVVLILHILTVIWPWLAEFSRHYWWVWLLIGGVILIAAAARYEASLKSMRTLASRISDLR